MEKTIEAVDRLLRTCIEFFGPNWTLFFLFAIPIGLFIFRVYKDWIKRNEVNETIRAKDETIQIQAEQNRQLRVIELRHLGWSEEAINQIVMTNTPKNAIEARDLLESTDSKIKDELANVKGKKDHRSKGQGDRK